MIRLMVRLVAVGTVLAAVAVGGAAARAADSSLRRYPYPSDVVDTSATVNWATTQNLTSGTVKYGQVGTEACDAHSATASKTSTTVGSTPEYQWKAKLTVTAGATYCYRVYSGSADLLAGDPSPQFQVPSSASATFAVFGDWGDTSNGFNSDQANLMARIASSPAQFAVTTGDTAYPSGSQTNYGDLVQTGTNVSAIFGPQYWTVPGKRMPLYSTLGNHGLNSTFLMLWPQTQLASSSGGRSVYENYCCVDGTNSANYPSVWYAFDVAGVRLYVLDAAWANSNIGTGSLYKDDYDAHWASGSAELSWLQGDLAQHQGQPKLAFFHFPLHSDNRSETTDSYLSGLESLLAGNQVRIVFNGHAHMYQRNKKVGGMVSYVTGGGGAHLEWPDGGCSPTDAYAIGWSYSSNVGKTCGPATRPSSPSQVFHFLLVTISGGTVTVTPTDSTGRTFDSQAYAP